MPYVLLTILQRTQLVEEKKFLQFPFSVNDDKKGNTIEKYIRQMANWENVRRRRISLRNTHKNQFTFRISGYTTHTVFFCWLFIIMVDLCT